MSTRRSRPATPIIKSRSRREDRPGTSGHDAPRFNKARDARTPHAASRPAPHPFGWDWAPGEVLFGEPRADRKRKGDDHV